MKLGTNPQLILKPSGYVLYFLDNEGVIDTIELDTFDLLEAFELVEEFNDCDVRKQ